MTANKSLKDRFEQYVYLGLAIERLEHKINEAYGSHFRCSVQSSNGPGYTLINESIGGYDNIGHAQERIQEMRSEVFEFGTEMDQVEKIIDSIPDLRTRQIMSLRYLDGKRWRDVVASLGHRESESSVKMVAKRFFETCDECDQCDETA